MEAASNRITKVLRRIVTILTVVDILSGEKGNSTTATTTSAELRRFFSWSARWYDAFLKALFVGTVDEYRRAAARAVSPGGTDACLDLASGTGGNAFAFADTHPLLRIVALDISPEMLKKARSHRTTQNIEFVRANVEHLPFKKESFDITMDSCAYHFLHPNRSWPEILRVTKGGGRIVDIDIISRFWDNPFLNPFLRPCIFYQRLLSKVQPLEIPQSDFFRSIGLRDVSKTDIGRPLATLQVVVGHKPEDGRFIAR
jgi:ubiquinone/menaquinone biosynthesis C-methylase UbiE